MDGTPVVFEYTNTKEDFVVHYRVSYPGAYLSARNDHYRSTAYWLMVLLLSIWSSVAGNNVFVACVLTVIGIHLLWQATLYKRHYRQGIQESFCSRQERKVRLEIKEDGLFETVEGIQSFVPWSSVRRYVLFQDTLIIELAANLAAIVPQRSLAPASPPLSTLIELLKHYRVEESRPKLSEL